MPSKYKPALTAGSLLRAIWSLLGRWVPAPFARRGPPQLETPAAASVDARRPFEGMPPAKRRRVAAPVPPPAAGGAGGIDALPDEILRHILGFLDPREAVATCVLSRRWRHLWRSATSLTIYWWKLAQPREFLEHLLEGRRLREDEEGQAPVHQIGWPIHKLELWFDESEHGDEASWVNLWLRYALLFQVQVLALHTPIIEQGVPQLHDLPLFSKHLRSIRLSGIQLQNRTCDFYGCPSLEDLRLDFCLLLSVGKISSKSLKFLSLRFCCFNQDKKTRTLISAPSLVSLVLTDWGCQYDHSYRTPVLDSMPALEKAFVRLVNENADTCTHADSGNCGHQNCNPCYGVEHDNSGECVLLKGLSEAENLTLMAVSKTFIFKRDLKQCPTFSKLKTLTLNDHWCVAPDFHELTCILKRSPVLEKLTLYLFSEGANKDMLRIKGRWNPTEISAAISSHLKEVEVKFEAIDAQVINVLKCMSTFNIRFSLDDVEVLE